MPKLYIMSTGEARRSQLTISFNVVKKHGEISNQRPGKRLTRDIEDLIPEMLVSQASPSTITKEGGNTNTNLLIGRPPKTHNTDAFSIQLNRLCKKSAQYSSHKDFLSPCMQKELVPKGLELSLEPIIGNYDQELINNWYSNLKEFSRILMKQIVAFCEKTKEKTQTSITEIEATLKQQLKKDDYAEIQNTIKVNKTATKQILHLTIQMRKEGNITLRNNSNTNMAKNNKYQQEINELKEEIKLLKQSKKQQHDPKTEIYKNTKFRNKKTRTKPLRLTRTNKKMSN